MSHKPRKRFGQNFLQNQFIIEQILHALCLDPKDKVIEIGPGKGALTRLLLNRLNNLTAIEIDRDLQVFLTNTFNSTSRLHLIGADALTINYENLGNHLRILGNLPYNISTPLLFHLLSFVTHIKDMHFMLQKEVVERLAAAPGSKDYGRLSVIVQYHCEVTPLFDVSPDAFYPKPKVESAVVRLVPYPISPYPAVKLKPLQDLVAKAFSMRRKTLANNLKPLISAQELADLRINASDRPEQISLVDYIKIANYITNRVKLN